MRTNSKLYMNALIGERLFNLSGSERKAIILRLSKFYSLREIARLSGIGYSTIQDWSSGRQDNTGKSIHVSLALIYRKLEGLDVCDITDWGRIEMIRDRCVELLNRRKNDY